MDRFTIIAPPTALPVSSLELMQHLRLDDGADEESAISLYLAAAVDYVESLCGPLIAQTWELALNDWPASHFLTIRKPRVSSVVSITYTDAAGNAGTVDPADYLVDTASHHARVLLRLFAAWPSVDLQEANGVVVRFVAGWANAAAVPAPIKQAILLLAGWMYEQRLPVNVGNIVNALPFSVDALLANYREWGV